MKTSITLTPSSKSSLMLLILRTKIVNISTAAHFKSKPRPEQEAVWAEARNNRSAFPLLPL
jgi:hypothetical protein